MSMELTMQLTLGSHLKSSSLATRMSCVFAKLISFASVITPIEKLVCFQGRVDIISGTIDFIF
jgi:hypothetical protein